MKGVDLVKNNNTIGVSSKFMSSFVFVLFDLLFSFVKCHKYVCICLYVNNLIRYRGTHSPLSVQKISSKVYLKLTQGISILC